MFHGIFLSPRLWRGQSLQQGDIHPELNPKTYGFGDDDWDRPIFIDNVLGMESASLRQIMEIVKETYCGSIGIEFMHVQDPAQKAWIQERIESIRNATEFTKRGKKAIYERLVGAETFEQFLHKKYAGTKRFGLDGGESLIPALEQIIKRGGNLGVKEIRLLFFRFYHCAVTCLELSRYKSSS